MLAPAHTAHPVCSISEVHHNHYRTGCNRRQPGGIPGAHGLCLPHVTVRLDPDGQPHGVVSLQPGLLRVPASSVYLGSMRYLAMLRATTGESSCAVASPPSVLSSGSWRQAHEIHFTQLVFNTSSLQRQARSTSWIILKFPSTTPLATYDVPNSSGLAYSTLKNEKRPGEMNRLPHTVVGKVPRAHVRQVGALKKLPDI